MFALAFAASVLLSFFPFLMVMLSFCRNALQWPAAVDAIFLALNDYFPGELGEFVKRNLLAYGKAVKLTSMLLLLFTANAVFEPMEVALNRIWGVRINRSYARNQLVSLGLIFVCGGLTLLSLILTALNREWVAPWMNGHGSMDLLISLVMFKAAALPISMLALFLIYWLLPNRKIAPLRVAPVAILVGLALEGLKYINLLIWPRVRDKLEREYGPFQFSVTILLWSFVTAMIILAGAEWAARREQSERETRERPRQDI